MDRNAGRISGGEGKNPLNEKSTLWMRKLELRMVRDGWGWKSGGRDVELEGTENRRGRAGRMKTQEMEP